MELLEYYVEEIGASDLYNYAIQTIIMYTDRLDAYMGTLLNLDEHMVAFSNAVFTEFDDRPISNKSCFTPGDFQERPDCLIFNMYFVEYIVILLWLFILLLMHFTMFLRDF